MSEKFSEEDLAGNTCGIPETKFLEDVDSFMQEEENESVEEVLARLEERHKKYKFMEYNLTTKKSRLQQQFPDIKTSLDLVHFLKKKKEAKEDFTTYVQAADNVYIKALIRPVEEVNLWLGANVMMEYKLNSAETLLTENHANAKSSIADVENDLEFLRNQITTVEVNMARVYNWDVKKRQANKEKSG